MHAYGKFDDEGNNPVNNPNIYDIEGDNPVNNPNIYDIEGNNPVNNPNIYDIEGDNRLSPGLQPMTTVSVLKTVFFF